MNGFNINDWEIFLRLLSAAVLAGLVGLERERSHRAAGLRTYILVAIGSALFTLIGAYAFPLVGNTRDPARVAAQIVTGIGFLGAGTILRQGVMIRGLTTAAGLWAVAAIGMACGVGWYKISFITTLLVIVVLALLKAIEKTMGEKIPATLLFTTPHSNNVREKIKELLKEYKIIIINVEIDEKDGNLIYQFMLDIPHNLDKEHLIGKLLELGTSSIQWRGASC